MKRTLKLFFSLAIIVALSSCGTKTVHETTRPMANQQWNHFKPEKFDFQIEDTSKFYKTTFGLKLNRRMNERYIPITMVMNYPSGELRTEAFYLFTDSATIVDGFSEFVLQPYKQFNQPGKYHYEIIQNTSKFDLEGVEEVRLKVVTVPPRKSEDE